MTTLISILLLALLSVVRLVQVQRQLRTEHQTAMSNNNFVQEMKQAREVLASLDEVKEYTEVLGLGEFVGSETQMTAHGILSMGRQMKSQLGERYDRLVKDIRSVRKPTRLSKRRRNSHYMNHLVQARKLIIVVYAHPEVQRKGGDADEEAHSLRTA